MIVYIIFVVNFFPLFIHSVLILFFHCASLVLLVSGFVHLEILDLENNDLSEFSSFSSLGKLPSLRQLNLNANHIRLLHFSESFSKGEFVHLSCILLADNCIDEWSTVDDLAHISSLVETRLQRNILFVKSSPSLARGLIIARLPRLTELNGAEVFVCVCLLYNCSPVLEFSIRILLSLSLSLNSARFATIPLSVCLPLYAFTLIRPKVREKERIDAEKMYLKKFCIPDLSVCRYLSSVFVFVLHLLAFYLFHCFIPFLFFSSSINIQTFHSVVYVFVFFLVIMVICCC